MPRTIDTPIGFAHQLIERREMPTGKKMAGALPTFPIVGRNTPWHAFLHPFPIQEILIKWRVMVSFARPEFTQGTEPDVCFLPLQRGG
jgi:hypothetical protein